MAQQPVSGAQYKVISGGVGTAVISSEGATLVRVIIPGTYVGTVLLHDSATAAGTTTTSAVLTLGLPNTTVAGNIEVGANFKNGIVYEATGTPLMTIVWDK